MTTKGQRKSVRRRVGDLLAIPLGEKQYAFGCVLPEPLVGFYRMVSDAPQFPTQLDKAGFDFKICVMNHAITSGRWMVIGRKALKAHDMEFPDFFKIDPISKRLTIYRDRDGTETPASREEIQGLECAAVWSAEHVEERIRDELQGKKNQYVQLMENDL